MTDSEEPNNGVSTRVWCAAPQYALTFWFMWACELVLFEGGVRNESVNAECWWGEGRRGLRGPKLWVFSAECCAWVTASCFDLAAERESLQACRLEPHSWITDPNIHQAQAALTGEPVADTRGRSLKVEWQMRGIPCLFGGVYTNNQFQS